MQSLPFCIKQDDSSCSGLQPEGSCCQVSEFQAKFFSSENFAMFLMYLQQFTCAKNMFLLRLHESLLLLKDRH